MFDPIKLITSVAPVIGKAATGNLMGAVSEGLKVFGIDKGGPKELANAIQNASPEQLAELKRVDNEFDIKIKEMDVGQVLVAETTDPGAHADFPAWAKTTGNEIVKIDKGDVSKFYIKKLK